MFSTWSEMAEALLASGVDDSTVTSIREVCELSGLTPFQVLSFQESELVDKLYLTEKEARVVLHASTALDVRSCESGFLLGERLEVIREMRETTESVDKVEDEALVVAAEVAPVDVAPLPALSLSPAPSLVSPLPLSGNGGIGRSALGLGRLSQSASFSPAELGLHTPSTSQGSKPSFAQRLSLPRSAHASPSPSPASKGKTGTRSASRPSSASTLYAPTAAFLSRVAGAQEKGDSGEGCYKASSSSMAGSKRLSTGSFGSLCLSPATLGQSPGQRATKPKPFNLGVDARTKETGLSTEDIELLENKKQWKPQPAPHHVHQNSPLELSRSQRSTPKVPSDVFKPFKLATEDRGGKSVAKVAAKHALEEAHKADIGRFKASVFDKSIFQKVTTFCKPEPLPLTLAKGPSFKSEERSAHYLAEIQPKKMAAMSEVEKERMALRQKEVEDEDRQIAEAAELKRKERELANLSVGELRKSMVFKASPMPDFSSPFRPAAQPVHVTHAVEFNFTTDSRLGKVPSLALREDAAGTQHAASFHQSLRSPLSLAQTMGGMVNRSVRLNSRSTGACPQEPKNTPTRPATASHASELEAALGAALEAVAMASPRAVGATLQPPPAMSSPRRGAMAT